jgi:phage tail-like protein
MSDVSTTTARAPSASHREGVPGLASPHPLGLMLPGVYHGDAFTQAFCEALDAVFAPVLLTLDSMPAYFDPDLAPADFVEWLATWVGLEIDENWPLEHQRELLARTVDLYSRRGTTQGITDVIALYTGIEPTVEDSGGTTWSAAPGEAAPGSPTPNVVVRLQVPAGVELDPRRVDAVIAAVVPAHVSWRVEIEQDGAPPPEAGE